MGFSSFRPHTEHPRPLTQLHVQQQHHLQVSPTEVCLEVQGGILRPPATH